MDFLELVNVLCQKPLSPTQIQLQHQSGRSQFRVKLRDWS